MGIKIITPPDLTALVSDADLRKHLRIAADGSEDELARVYFKAAHAAAEHHTGRPIGSQTRELALDAFPGSRIFRGPAAPRICFGTAATEIDLGPAVTEITSLKYIDTAGVEQTVSAASYALDDYGLVCRLVPAVGVTWPSTQITANAVKVRFVAGNLPEAVRSALLLMTAWLYENRGDDSTLTTGRGSDYSHQRDDIQPSAAKALLSTVKVWGF